MIKKYALPQVITVLIFLLSFQLALAAIPPTLNYQGHLTDSSGVPIDGSVDMQFAIYDVATGGTAPLWSASRSVIVDQGVFSVELGSSTAPLPPGLFESPLWMGLTIGADAQMTPLRPISSVGFSFKAGDADRLEGISASTLDQSAHVTDTANPHSVTASQVGAADAATLSAHTSNTSNPHSVTAAQTGSANLTDFTTHTSSSASHHLRYTNAEAVVAMGATGDSNTLNHSKRSDAQVMSAVTSLDGAGSTLDADLVDGLQASEIIDAAQDEVRTPISSLPFTITTSGSYYHTGNLDGSSGGININVDKVTLDLMGFTIDGGGSVSDQGVDFTGRSSIVIKNGFIANFGLAGIYQSSTSARYATVMDVQVLGNGALGTGSNHSGMYLLSTNSHVERCTAGDNGGHGIYAYHSSKLINNTAYNNTGSVAIYGSSGATLTGNTAYNNASTYAIYGSSGATLTGNTAYLNTGTYAIYGNLGATLTGNTVYYNTGWGIYGSGSNLIKDNMLSFNNTGNTAGVGGLHESYDSRVAGNTLDNNNQNNIYVSGSGNTIENNLLTDSPNGIFFVTSGNFYGNNRASGNTTNFNLNGTTQSTNTYLPNISF